MKEYCYNCDHRIQDGHNYLCPVPELESAKVRLTLLEAVLASAEAFLASFPQHYHGFPGKLQWPEIHVLKQSCEAIRAVDAAGKGEG